MIDFSFQLFSARKFPILEEVLKKLASLGYRQVEGYGGNYDNIDRLTKALQRTGLHMTSGHFDLAQLEDDVENCLAIASATGMKAIFCPFLEPENRPDDAQGWRAFGARLQAISKPYIGAGFDFGWHNHDYEFVSLDDGSTPIDRIFEGGPGLNWQIDIAWVTRAGADISHYIEKHAERITAVHIKDIAPAGENADEDGWADVGHGTVDWPTWMRALKSTKARHFVIEHDNPNDLNRFAGRSLIAAQSF